MFTLDPTIHPDIAPLAWLVGRWEGTGLLGYPTTNETVTPDGVGRFNHYSRQGSIYWTPGTGAWSVTGAIQEKGAP